MRIGPDGWLYFGVGTATNSGLVGVDNYEYGWLRRYPQFHDIPPYDLRLRGQNFQSDNPFTGGTACTGAYVPFGTPTSPGQVIPGQLPCNGVIQEFMVNRCGPGPASIFGGCGLERPVDVRFNNDGSMLYVVDFGAMTVERQGQATPYHCTGVLWRVTRTA